MNGPHVSSHHGRYTVEWGDPERAILELDYLRSDHGDVTAEITATSTAPSIGGVVHVARVNLLSTRSLAEFAGHVAKRAPGPSTDWMQLVGIAAREVVLLHRRGEPAVLLRDVAPAEDDGHVLSPLAVARMPSILFGDGGAAKSLLALAAAASIQTGGRSLASSRRPSATSVTSTGRWTATNTAADSPGWLGPAMSAGSRASSTSRAAGPWPTTSTGFGARSFATTSAT